MGLGWESAEGGDVCILIADSPGSIKPLSDFINKAIVVF